MKDDAKFALTDDFREYIKQMREKRGLSLREVARRAGIDSGGLVGIENGRIVHCPRPETLKGIAQALNVPETELLARVGYNVTPPDLQTYLHQRYGHLPAESIARVCAYVERLVTDYAIDSNGPGEHEDETVFPPGKTDQIERRKELS